VKGQRIKLELMIIRIKMNIIGVVKALFYWNRCVVVGIGE